LAIEFLFDPNHPLCQYIIDENLCIPKSDLRAMLKSEKMAVDALMRPEQKILFNAVIENKDIFESKDELFFSLAFDDNTVFLPIALLIELASNAIIFSEINLTDQFKKQINSKKKCLQYYFKKEIFEKEKIDDLRKRDLLVIFLHFFKEHMVKSEDIRKSLEVFTSFFNLPVFKNINMHESNDQYAFMHAMYAWYTSQDQEFIEKNVANTDKDLQEIFVYFNYAFHLLQEENETRFYNYCLDELVYKIVSIDSDEKVIQILSSCFNHMFNHGSNTLEKIFSQNRVRFFIFNRILMGEPRWGGPMDIDTRYDYDELKAPWYKLFVKNIYNLVENEEINTFFWEEYTDFWFNYCFPYRLKKNEWDFSDEKNIHRLIFKKIDQKILDNRNLVKNFESYKEKGYIFSKFFSNQPSLKWSNIDLFFFDFEKKEKNNRILKGIPKESKTPRPEDIKYHKLIAFKKWSELLFFDKETYNFGDYENTIDLSRKNQQGINNLIEEINEIKHKQEEVEAQSRLYTPMPKQNSKQFFDELLNKYMENLKIAKLNNANVTYFEEKIKILKNSIDELNKEDEKTKPQWDKWKNLKLKSKNLDKELETLESSLNILVRQCFISHIFFSVPSNDQIKIASDFLFKNNVVIKNIDISFHDILLKENLEKEDKNFDILYNLLKQRINSKNSKILFHDLVGDILKKRGQNYSFNYIALNLQYLFSNDQKTLDKLIKKAKNFYNYIEDINIKKMLKDILWELSICSNNKFDKQYTSMRDFILYQTESGEKNLREKSKDVIEKTENYIINTIFSNNDDICNETEKIKLLLYATYHQSMYKAIKDKNLENNLSKKVKLYLDFIFHSNENTTKELEILHEKIFGRSKLFFEDDCPYPIFNPIDMNSSVKRPPEENKIDNEKFSDRYYREYCKNRTYPLHVLNSNKFKEDLLSLKN